MIFTYVWAFDLTSEERYVNKVMKIFQDKGAKVYYVELEANLKERLKRNETTERLKHKPTKRNLKLSKKKLLEHETEHRFNTNKNELHGKNYLKINNTTLSAKEVAKMIKKEFKL